MAGATRRIGRALRHRNYRLFFAGQSVSLIGTWLTRFATVWMVYRLTKSGIWLGLIGFFGQAPAAVLAPIAGVLVDRWDRRRTIIATQIAAMLQSAALAALALTGTMTVWYLLLLGALQAVINAFDMPARQSFLGQMVGDRSDLPNAIALNSSMVNGARLIGPVVAAVLVDAVGEGWCFAADAASYLAVIASLLAIRVTPRPARQRSGHVLDEMRDGLAYVRSVPLVKAVLVLLVATSVLAGSYSTLLPMVAAESLGGSAHTLGVLMGAAGCGALTGALYLANRSSVLGLGSVIARCALGLGAGMVLLELAHSIWIAAPILFAIGLCLMVQLAATNTVIQSIVDEDKLGRVMSLYAVAFFGGAPIGAALEGSIADQIGVVHAFLLAGAGCLTCATVFVRALPRLRIASRPLYVKLGLLDE